MTFRDELREVALDQHGYVTTRDAQRLGIPSIELRKLASRGKLENVARGVYRFPDLPHSSNDEYAAAVLTAGNDAYLTGLSVLALHELAQVNPRTIDVAVGRRVRLSHPGAIRLVHQDVPEADRRSYDGIPSVSVARALVDAVKVVMSDRLLKGADDARSRGLLSRAEHVDVLARIGQASAEPPALAGASVR